MKKITLLNIFCLLFLPLHSINAQINFGGTPYTFGSEWKTKFEDNAEDNLKKNPETNIITLPKPDMAKIREEDSQRSNSRFAYPIYVNYNLQNSGQWTDIGGGNRIWRLTIETQDAWCLRPIFDEYYLPKGVKLFIYNQDHSEVLGAFTQESYAGKGRFATDIVEGNGITIELFEPAHAKNQSKLQLWRIGYGYRKNGFTKQNGLKNGNGTLGFGSSGSCNVNINCTLGNDWQNQKRGIVKIVVGNINGDDWCSGSLINTANNSGMPYILSAKHCEDDRGQTFIDTWIFIFNYESTGCTNPATQPSRGQSIAGADILAMGNDTDFLLLKLRQDIPTSYNPYFNGWDRGGNAPTSGACIHHPDGDIKKIAIESDQVLSQSYYDDQPNENNHWRAIWNENTTTEGGSSGSPFFDQNGRIVGQLRGGEASCVALNSPDWFGKFSISWNAGALAQNRLRDWLDPTNLNPLSVNGTNFIPNALENNIFTQNTIVFPNPVTDKCFIKIQNPQNFGKNIELKITNLEGKVFYQESNNLDQNIRSNSENNLFWQKEISLKNLPKGIYFLQAQTEKYNFNKKIVVE